MPVRFLKAAQNDLRDAVRFYESQRSGLGADFRKEIRAVIARINSHPDAWHPLTDKIRRCRTRRYPYGVIYHDKGDEILIIAVSHLHREPIHWEDRI